jgi:integrative and conjugative element protein (TIGR02256 family)
VTFRDRARSVTVEINEATIEILRHRRQPNGASPERGGQLFGEVHTNRVIVTEATGARPGDKATPSSFVIDRRAAQREIDIRYRRGIHFLGDWHTHPVPCPSPSGRDLRSMHELFRTSRHELQASLMLIVGENANPTGWHCSLHNGEISITLEAVRDHDDDDGSPTETSTRLEPIVGPARSRRKRA